MTEADPARRRKRNHRAPWWVAPFNPVAKLLLRAGVPLGPNALLTVRGRHSGQPRATPVAVIENGGRRWIWAPWGEVNWVRNLRAAGRGQVQRRDGSEEVRATELDHEQRLRFFRDELGTVARRLPGGAWFIRTVDGVDLDDPEAAAVGRPVFELHPVEA